jgi:aminopeptidase N
MFHHWFGDLVTCESWSNLTVNESFANYSEYLWFEHKYGKDAAQDHLRDEAEGYFGQARSGIHPLVYFDYEEKEDMFDAHSYNKGGCILHMLRNYVGDDAFFASLKNYLTKNAYNTGEAHQLRLAFEEVTGEDLNWFFNQWYFSAGHPSLDISYAWNEADKSTTVTITQKQDLTKSPLFRLPMNVDVYADGGVRTHKIVLTDKEQSFNFRSNSKPSLVNVDADKALLGRKSDAHTEEEWIFMYKNAKNYFDRYEALVALKKLQKSSPKAKQILKDALKDKYYGLRNFAISGLSMQLPADDATVDELIKIAKNDSESKVRSNALDKLAKVGTETKDRTKYTNAAKEVMSKDKSYKVLASSLGVFSALDPDAAIDAVKVLDNEDSEDILAAISEIYASSGNAKYAPFFQNAMKKASNYNLIGIADKYAAFLTKTTDAAVVQDGTKLLSGMATNFTDSPWSRFAGANGVRVLREHFISKNDKVQAETMDKIIRDLKAKETNSQLKAIFAGW